MSILMLGITFYFIGMGLIGYWASRRVKTLEDYLIAGRKLPIYLAVPTIVATWFGAGSCMGVSGTVYNHGFYGVLADPFGCTLALVIAGLFFVAPFRRLKLLTISDLLKRAYGERYERIATLLMIPFYIGTLAAQMVAIGYVFHIVSGMDAAIGTLCGTLIFVMYTVAGGMWAVTITDFIQFGLLALGLCLLLPICFEQIPNHQATVITFIHEFSTLIPAEDSSASDWLGYAGRILMTGFGAIMGQDLLQRSMASRSESVARYSAIIGAFFYLLLGMIPLFIGIAGREIFPSLEQPELLIPLLAKTYLSPLAFTLFACGILSIIMSTADSYLLAGTSLLTHNVLLKIWKVKEERDKIRILRLVNVLLALLALALSFSGQSIFDMMVHSGATLFVAIFIPVCGALFWKNASPASAWCGSLGGTFAWLAFIGFNYGELSTAHEEILFSAAVCGAASSLLFYVIGSKVSSISRFSNIPSPRPS